jgi:hypothetical protein
MEGDIAMDDNGWQQKVRERAYAIWEQEGRPEGQGQAGTPGAEMVETPAGTIGTKT